MTFSSLEEYIQEIRIGLHKGDYDEITDLLKKARIDGFDSYELYLMEAELMRLVGDFELALALSKRCLNLYDKSESKFATYTIIAYIQWNKGDMEKSTSYLEKAEELLKGGDLIDEKYIGQYYIVLGNLYWSKGDMHAAQKVTKVALSTFINLDDQHEISHALHNLGAISWSRGDLKEAMEYFTKSLSIEEKLGNNTDIAFTLNNIGNILFLQNRHKEAENYLLESYQLRKDLRNPYGLSESLYSLVSFYLYLDDLQSANVYLKQLKTMFDEQVRVDKIIRSRYMFCKGYYLSKQKRIKPKFIAMGILSRIIKEDVVEHNITTDAMKIYIGLLIEELRKYGSHEIIDEIQDFLDKFEEHSRKLHGHPTIIDVMILRSKLEMILGNFDDVIELLNEGRMIAENRGFTKISHQIMSEIENLEEEINSMQQMINNKADYSERINKMKLDEYIKYRSKFSRN